MNTRFGATLIAVKSGLPFQDSNLVQYFDTLKKGGDATMNDVTAAFETPSAVALTTNTPISRQNRERLPVEIAQQAPDARVLLSQEINLTPGEVEDVATGAKTLSVLA